MSYIALSTIRFLDFVHHLVFIKVTQFWEPDPLLPHLKRWRGMYSTASDRRSYS